MKRLSFHSQLELVMGIVIMCLMGAMAMQSAVFIHFGFILIGTVFVLNPIAPPQWAASYNVELGIRLMAMAMILTGILTL